MKHKIYCESDFLESFISSLQDVDLLDFLQDGDFNTLKLYKLFFEHSVIEVDLSDEEIKTKIEQNPYFKKLIRNQAIKSSKSNLEDFDSLKQNSAFFLERQDWEAEKYQEKHGLWFFGKDYLNRIGLFFKSQDFSFNKKNRFKNFDFVYPFKHPVNAMVITDDYLFNDSKQYDKVSIEQNLIPIIKKFANSKIEADFQLTIISCPKNFSLDIDLIVSEIKQKLSSFAQNIRVNFVNYNFHARYIFTNQFFIKSDKGFRNITKNKYGRLGSCNVKNDFDIKSVYNSGQRDHSYVSNLLYCKELSSNYILHGDQFENRLFDLN